MFMRLCQRMLRVASTFLHLERGSILIYTGAFMAVGVGGAALSIDIGRIVLLKTQMQNRADAGALGGAAQLDALPGAIERAEIVVRDSMKAWTTAAADSEELVVLTVTIYEAAEDNITRGAITTDDNAARFVEVLLERRTLSFFYAPAVRILQGGNADNFTEVGARAVAMSDPFVCKAQPLMICNPFDNGDGTHSADINSPVYAGKGVILKSPIQGGGSLTPGNFGMLALPADDSYNGSGNSAVAVEEAIAAVDPEACFGIATLETAPGAMVVNVSRAINTRFGMPVSDNTVIPAPEVMNYPKDPVQDSNDPAYDPLVIVGDGAWPRDTYWTANHAGVTRPTVLDDASRYQTYLFEQNITYWKKNGSGKQTGVTLLEPAGGGWTEIIPSAISAAAAIIPTDATDEHNNNVDGEPPPLQTPADFERRILRVALMDCLTHGISGKDVYPSQGEFMGIFLTQESPPVQEGGTIFGEIIGPVAPRLSLEFHGNVRLVE